MSSGTIKVFHFNNGSGGGVLTVIRNLLRYSQHEEIENHVIYTINADQIKEFKIPGLTGAASEQVFNYSPRWNFSYTCRKLSKLLPDEKVVIVAHDWLELGMVTHTGSTNPVIQILHGDYGYYYDLSIKHADWIDGYIAVAEVMADNLRKKMPARFNDICYLPFPVPHVVPKNFLVEAGLLQIIFIGRLTREKGFYLLPLIESGLQEKGIGVKWNIVGEATEADRLIWPANSETEFYGQLSNDEVLGLLPAMDCLILPSLAEGMPVTLVEAMKAGLTCLVNDLEGGIQHIIINGITGYKVEKNEISSYVQLLELLHREPQVLKEIGKNALAKANAQFDPFSNTKQYEQLFVKYFNIERDARKVGHIYGSRLDKAWIPNFITNAIRSF